MRRFTGFLPFAALLVFSAVPGWSRDLTRYAIVLTDPPAATLAARQDRVGMEAAVSRIRNNHTPLKAELQRRNIEITGESQTLLNAVFVALNPALNQDQAAAQISQLELIPGVSFVAKMPRYELQLDAAEKLIGVPAAWTALGGISNAGAGVKIGIIDTGIDNTHPAFQDASLTPPPTFPKCDVPANCAFTNNKIIVARSFVSLIAAGSGNVPAANSRPDDFSARDHVGHGTAVAMAAAGVTSAGPVDTITGVAPKAFLGSYKIFGSPGVNDYTSGQAIIQAIEAAYSDGMNIAVLSLGGTATAPASADPEVLAIHTATAGGMLVVVAAGNNGSAGSSPAAHGTVTSPADSPDAIAVGATTNSHQFANPLVVSGLGTFQSLFGTGPVPVTAFTLPLSDIANVGIKDPLGCSPVPANSLAGTIALIARGTCVFAIKVQNAQLAGAVGVIFTNNAGDNSLVEAGGLQSTLVPATFIGYDDGQTIRAYLQTNSKATATFGTSAAQPFPVASFNQVASFSSRGPVLGATALKPDIAAAGTDLYLAAQNYDPNGSLYSASRYIVSQGTSFSTPQVAGVAALVLQEHPAWTPAQLKSALVNTATQDVLDNGATASVTAVGAGKASAGAAVATNLTASPPSVSFGIVKTLPSTQLIQFANTGTTALSLTFSLSLRTTESTAHVTINSNSLALAAGQTGSISMALSGTVPAAGAYEGLLNVKGAANPLVIPFYYVVGNGVPADIIAVAGNGDTGIAGQANSEGVLELQVLDTFGVPVTSEPVQFLVTSGGGKVTSVTSTNTYGFSSAFDTLGATPGTNVFTAVAGPLSTTFTITSTLQPAITTNGAVNAANSTIGQGFAPGSYVTLFGSNLAVGPQAFPSSYLPIALNGTSVSFDTAGTSAMSVPGYLWYVSAAQINVQIPWDLASAVLAGVHSAQIKVDQGPISGALYTLPLAAYSPAFFENPVGFAAALDQNNNVVTAAKPVAQGSVVQLFLNGLGPVSNQPASGQPSPASPLATTTARPVVTIGGIVVPDSQISFSGLTPGSIGLYQINAVVPATGAGLQPVTVSIGGVVSSTSHIQID